jgi:hypothetical protein
MNARTIVPATGLSKPNEVQVRGVRDPAEVAEAIEGMLARSGTKQHR